MSGRAGFYQGYRYNVDKDHRLRAAGERLAKRTMKAVQKGQTDLRVKGELIGLFDVRYGADVYEAAAKLLVEQGVEIEVHRLSEKRYLSQRTMHGIHTGFPSATNPGVIGIDHQYDVIDITRIGETPIERSIEINGPSHVAQMYPPQELDT